MLIPSSLRQTHPEIVEVIGSAAALVAIAIFASGCGCSSMGGPGGFGGQAGQGGGSSSGRGGNGHGGAGGSNFVSTGAANGGASAAGGGQNCGTTLPVTIRDFSPTTQPDFEYVIADDRGMVEADLGSDHKPVYAGMPDTPTTHGKMFYDMWYRDTANVNINIPFSISLTPGMGGVYTYDNQAYFPIDNQGWGNEGNPHNFHFTSEVHTQFEYKGGEVFTFTGDDDLWTFINEKLAIDLGGVHGAETASVDLDMMASTLGITVGNKYRLDVFGAERHTTESHFRVDTTIGCFMPPPPD
jgi:fibro-slime domain-containing protein